MYWLVEEWNANFEKWWSGQIFWATDETNPLDVIKARASAQKEYDHRAKTCRKVRMTEMIIVKRTVQEV